MLVFIFDLQATNTVLEEKRNGPEVCMAGYTHSSIQEIAALSRWIVIQTQLAVLFTPASEEARLHGHRLGDSGQQMHVQIMASFVKLFHECTEAWKIRFILPYIGV